MSERAAERKKAVFHRFDELRPELVNFDFHMHTTQTDGKNSAEEMIAAAAERGLKSIAFSEHVNQTSDWYPEFFAKVASERGRFSLEVLIGIEAKPLDFEGSIDASAAILERAELVIGSVHRFPDGQGGLIPMKDVPSLGAHEAERIELELARALVGNPDALLDVLGHPMGITTSRFGHFPEAPLRELMATCKEHDVAFEISTKYCTDLPRLVSLLREVNPLVSIGSDAHEAAHVARSFEDLRKAIA